MSSRLQLDVRNLSLGMRHLVNAYEVEAGTVQFAGVIRTWAPWVWGTTIKALYKSTSFLSFITSASLAEVTTNKSVWLFLQDNAAELAEPAPEHSAVLDFNVASRRYCSPPTLSRTFAKYTGWYASTQQCMSFLSKPFWLALVWDRYHGMLAIYTGGLFLIGNML